MQEEPNNSNSMRFLLQMVVNIYLCKKGGNYLYEQIIKERKPSFKSYLYLVGFAMLLIGINQFIFFKFQPKNLYEQLQISRSMSPADIKNYGEELRVKIMSIDSMDTRYKMERIAQLDEMVSILTHPARRLTYDSFGYKQVEYAWSFKSQQFLISMIFSTSIFYIFSTFVSMAAAKRSQIAQAFKIQIMVSIILFIWEIDMIMNTENKLHSVGGDWLDLIFTAFPIYERRQMIKTLLIPSMNCIQFFVKFYIRSDSELKLVQIATQPEVRELTLKVREGLNHIRIDQHVEDRVSVALSEQKKSSPLATDIYGSQRDIIRMLIFLEGDSILPREDVNLALRYFCLK